MITKIQNRIQSNDENIDSEFIKLVISVSKYFPQYTIEYILYKMKIPRFLMLIDFIIENKPKKK